ncbi:hypothetical protein F5Y16DRAFT_396652 [Xylariaceae sp. FL0255]|nr:hypothetical protein F5Y16DRAFT_396652 [Xylariaceae sp. FL0255]
MDSQLPPDENRKRVLLVIWWTQVAVGSSFMFLRLWARWLRRSFGLDDLVMTIAWLIYIGDAVAIKFYAETGTRHAFYLTLPQLSYDIELALIIQAISVPCTALGKISIGLTLLRIVGPSQRWERWLILSIIISTATITIANVSLSLFRCGNPRALWDFALEATAKCLNAEAVAHFNVFTSAWQAFSDFIFSALPVPIVWQLVSKMTYHFPEQGLGKYDDPFKLPVKRKLFIIMALGLSLVTAAAAVTKTVLVAMIDPTDPTWYSTPSLIWFSTEVTLIIICGAVPALNPLWEVLFSWCLPGHRRSRSTAGTIRLTDENGTHSSRVSKMKLSRGASGIHHKSESSYSLELAQISAQISGNPYASAQPPVWISASPDERGSWANHSLNGRVIRVVNEVSITSERSRDASFSV